MPENENLSHTILTCSDHKELDKKEESEGTVSVRKHGGDDLGNMKVNTLIDRINKEIEEVMKFNN